MKKLTAIILSAILLVSLAVTVNAASDLSDVIKDGYTAYPLFDENGCYTEGVTFFHGTGEEIDEESIQACIGQGWPNNCVKDDAGNISFIVWSNASYLPFDRQIRVCRNNGDATVQVVFTGTGIRLGTGYRTNVGSMSESVVKVVIDGTEYPTDPDLLLADWEDDTTPTIFFEVEGLASGTHTLTVCSANGEFEFGWIEVDGSLGGTVETEAPATEAPATEAPATEAPSDPGQNPVTASYVTVAAALVVISGAAAVIVSKKRR